MEINLNSTNPCNLNSIIKAKLSGCGGLRTYEGKRPKGANAAEFIANYFACDASCPLCIGDPSIYFSSDFLDTPTTENYDGCAGSFRDTQDAFYKVIKKGLLNIAGDLGGTIATGFVETIQQPNHSFVSTVSSLDINTTNLAYNVNANISDKLKPSPAQHPFDAIYVPTSNEFHVAFNSSNIQWIIEEMGSIESKLSYVNYILTTNTNLAPVYNTGVYNFSRAESRRLLRSMSIIDGGKLYVNKNLRSDFGLTTPGSFPHNTGGSGSSPYIFPIAGSTYTLETCDCGNTEVKVDNNGEFIIGDNNTPINNKAVVLFHDGSTLHVKAGGKLTIRSGSKLIMLPNSTFIVEQGGQVIIEQGGELILQKNSVATSAGQITLNSTAKLTQEPLSSLTLNANSKLIVNDNAKVLVSTTYTNSVANDNAVFTFNQGAQLQLKGDNAVLELNGRLHIGDYANFSFTYPGSNSGYINFNRGDGKWWDNWAAGNAHITCGFNASFKLVGQSKTDKVMVINQNVVAMPKNIGQFSINKGLVEFNTFEASLESDNIFILNNATLKGIVTAPLTQSGRGVTMFGQYLFIAGNCDFLNLRTGINGALFYGNHRLSNVNNCLFKECKVGIQTFGAGTNLTNNTFLNNEQSISSQGLEYNSFVKGNTITAPLLASYSNQTIVGSSMGIVTHGNNGTYDFNNNTINNVNTAIVTVNNDVKLRCNDLTNNEFVLYGSTNSKINMSTLLGAGYNDASNAIKFAEFNEANFFEADQGYNSFKILDQSPCYTAVSPAPTHPSYVVCPIIADGSINNYTGYNTTTNKYELVAELNFWRSLYFPGNVIEHEYFNVTKVPVSSPVQKGELIIGTPLTSITQAGCPTNNGGGNGNGGFYQRVHPLDNNSINSSITTPSFYNKSLRDALVFSMSKMDNMKHVTKLNEAADLLTEILKYNYPSPILNQNDKYLLEVSYQKLFSCVAQLTELYSDSLGANSLPPSLNNRYNDLHTIINLRLSRKGTSDIDYKEATDLVKLDDALIYGLARQRTNAISVINGIIASNPKNEHVNLLEHWRCIYSTEEDAINHVISTEDAFASLLKCNNDYMSIKKQKTASGARKSNSNPLDEVFYAKDNAIAVYPNPTQGSVMMAYDLKDYTSITFEIFDVQGKKISSYDINAEEHQFNIDNLNLENGVYVYCIKADGKNLMTKKIVVMK